MSNAEHSSGKKRPVAVGIGLLALDLVISANASAPVVSWAGGTCGNVLTILSFLGWESFPVARLNDNPASLRVKNDLSRWGVRLDFAETSPTTSTPIIVQEIIQPKHGSRTHKFSWFCPQCGASLPAYQPVTTDSALEVAGKIDKPTVFFFDRVSSAAITLAKRCKALGATIVFEPSVEGDRKELEEAIKLADIVKYSAERISSMGDTDSISSCFLEVKTLGGDGLMFRARSEGHIGEWRNLQPRKVMDVVDSCGCGDWTTAGLIAKLCQEGVESFKAKSEDEITEALRFGQLLAAWNCQFEGARGGMYQFSSGDFSQEIERFLIEIK
jgi:sugar/nucleoside kinase (ribokinase family)